MRTIKFEDVKFPDDFKFEQTLNGFKINSTGGDFFPNKAFNLILIIILIISAFVYFKVIDFFKTFFRTKYSMSPKIEVLMIFGIVIVLVVMFIVLMIVFKSLTDIPTEFIFSHHGININSKKGKLFISKDNIWDIYLKDEEVHTRYSYYIKYCVYLKFKEPFYIPDTKKHLNTVDLFSDSLFRDKNIAFFLVQEIKKVFANETM